MIAFGDNKSYKRLFGIEKSDSNIIMPNYSDFLTAVSIIYSSELPRCKHTLRDQNNRGVLVKFLENFSHKVDVESMNKGAFLWLKSYVFNQEKQFQRNPIEQVFRYYSIFSFPGVIERIEEKIGMPFKTFIYCAFWIYTQFKDGFNVRINKIHTGIEYEKIPFSEKNLLTTFDALSIDFALLKKITKDEMDYSREFIFNNPDYPHIKYPLFNYDNICFCVNPRYLIDKFTENVYNLAEIFKGDNIAYGQSFENYVGKILIETIQYYSIENVNVIPEQIYNKGQNKTSDWIVQDKENIVFIECKAKKLTTISKVETEINEAFIKDVVEKQWFSKENKRKYIDSCENALTRDTIIIGMGIGKMYKVCNDYLNNKIDTLPFNSSQILRPILVTMEEWFAGIPNIDDAITEIAKGYLRYKSINYDLIDRIPFQIMSVSNLTIDFQMMVTESITQYYHSVSSNELMSKRMGVNFDVVSDLFEKEFFDTLKVE